MVLINGVHFDYSQYQKRHYPIYTIDEKDVLSCNGIRKRNKAQIFKIQYFASNKVERYRQKIREIGNSDFINESVYNESVRKINFYLKMIAFYAYIRTRTGLYYNLQEQNWFKNLVEKGKNYSAKQPVTETENL